MTTNHQMKIVWHLRSPGSQIFKLNLARYSNIRSRGSRMRAPSVEFGKTWRFGLAAGIVLVCASKARRTSRTKAEYICACYATGFLDDQIGQSASKKVRNWNSETV
jgi:hypothetical protein